jgi:hypothetical protein
MEGSKWIGSGLIAAVAVALAMVFTSAASAQVPTISVDSPSIDVGAQGTATVQALDIAAPGLGGWTVDVTYDPAVVSVVPGSCTGMICNESFAANMVRVVGFNAAGAVGTTTLAAISFQCGASVGSSALTLTAVEFIDATIGNPQPIAATVASGSVTCATPAPSAPPAPAPVLAEEAAPAVALPSGGGLPPASGGDAFPWVYLLMGAGALALLGSGALALRGRQER